MVTIAILVNCSKKKNPKKSKNLKVFMNKSFRANQCPIPSYIAFQIMIFKVEVSVVL